MSNTRKKTKAARKSKPEMPNTFVFNLTSDSEAPEMIAHRDGNFTNYIMPAQTPTTASPVAPSLHNAMFVQPRVPSSSQAPDRNQIEFLDFVNPVSQPLHVSTKRTSGIPKPVRRPFISTSPNTPTSTPSTTGTPDSAGTYVPTMQSLLGEDSPRTPVTSLVNLLARHGLNAPSPQSPAKTNVDAETLQKLTKSSFRK